jgi:hypothetical protein
MQPFKDKSLTFEAHKFVRNTLTSWDEGREKKGFYEISTFVNIIERFCQWRLL